MQIKTCDILVIGSGIAGLSFALHCAEYFKDKKVVVLSKGLSTDSNTTYAQGGIAAVSDHLHDSFQAHIDDTLLAGDEHCDKEIVELVVKNAPACISELARLGIHFDQKGEKPDLGREGGHSANRIVHCGDHTGTNIISALIQRAHEKQHIEIQENAFVLELRSTKQAGETACTGAIVRNKSGLYQLNAHYTMLASGGVGQLYELTSNPEVATGDGIALAKQIGARIQDMAFIQFHPTVLYEQEANRPFLISEAVRGFGAVLRNNAREEFMTNYDSRGSLATRDIVARAMFRELQLSGKKYLWLDLRHLDLREFELKFPTITKQLKRLNLHLSTDMIPVVPAAHYLCGGIHTDRWGQTTIPHLLAGGECARTGLHGANRLASNSLLEALVFARQAFEKLKSDFEEIVFENKSKLHPGTEITVKDQPLLRRRLQELMTAHVGIIRSKSGLLFARKEIMKMKDAIPCDTTCISTKELYNMYIVALEITEDSLRQNENRGTFFLNELAPFPEPIAANM